MLMYTNRNLAKAVDAKRNWRCRPKLHGGLHCVCDQLSGHRNSKPCVRYPHFLHFDRQLDLLYYQLFPHRRGTKVGELSAPNASYQRRPVSNCRRYYSWYRQANYSY